MKALTWNPQTSRVSLATVGDPKPGRGEVLVAPVAVGLCGTDRDIILGIHPVTQQEVAKRHLEYLIPGHEWSGLVKSLGDDVEGFSIGDRVVGEVGVPCGQCHACKGKDSKHCKHWREVGISLNGALAEYLVVPAASIHKFQPTLSWHEAALLEPLTVAVHAMRQVIRPRMIPCESIEGLVGSLKDCSVVVWGDGPIGLLIAQVMRLAKPRFLGIVGKSKRKLQIAESIGIEHTIFTGGATLAQAQRIVRRALAEEKAQPHIVFEAAGAPDAVRECVYCLEPGGQVILVGFPGTVPLDVSSIALKELTMSGSRSGDNSWDLAIALAQGHHVDLNSIITSTYELDVVEKAYNVLGQDQDNLKTVVRIRPNKLP